MEQREDESSVASSVGAWWKSSYSCGNGECVEVRLHANMIQVRDSKNPAGPILEFVEQSWKAFVRDVQANG